MEEEGISDSLDEKRIESALDYSDLSNYEVVSMKRGLKVTLINSIV